MLGALLVGTAVAETIAGIVTVEPADAVAVIGSGVLGAVIWNTLTWWRGLPSSSAHALVAGLAGSAFAAAGTGAVRWGGLDGWKPVGLPRRPDRACGVAPHRVRFGIASDTARPASAQASDAADRHPGQVKRVGHVGCAFLRPWRERRAEGNGGDRGPVAGRWPHTDVDGASVGEARVRCHADPRDSAGRLADRAHGGRRIYRLGSLDAFASQTAATVVILPASYAGAPLSTSHVVASSVVGIGVGRQRWRHVRWTVVRDIAFAWLLTLPAAAALGAVTFFTWRALG